MATFRRRRKPPGMGWCRIASCKYCSQVSSRDLSTKISRQFSFVFQEHFSIHRSSQLDYCYPFIVKTDPLAGRYCVASRDIAPCEIILREAPAVLGPYTPTSPLCLTCYAGVDLSYRCPSCNLPMCDDVCSRSEVHKLVRRSSEFRESNWETFRNVSMRLQRMLSLILKIWTLQRLFTAVLQYSGRFFRAFSKKLQSQGHIFEIPGN